jgi:hypothetical protein
MTACASPEPLAFSEPERARQVRVRDENLKRAIGGVIGLAIVTAAIFIPACIARVWVVAHQPSVVRP